MYRRHQTTIGGGPRPPSRERAAVTQKAMKPPPAPVEWHPVTQKLREEAEDPKKRLEVERMGAALASMKKKEVKK